MDNNNSQEQEEKAKYSEMKQQIIIEEGGGEQQDQDEQEGEERRESVQNSSKRIRKLSIEEVDLVKKYRKGREKNIIKIRQMYKNAQNMRENFQAIKDNFIQYLEKIGILIDERSLEIEEKVNQLEQDCIIPEIEEIRKNYDQSKSKDEEQFNEQLLESHINEQHMDLISKLILCKKNVTGDFDGIQTQKASILSEYMQQINQCISNLHEYAENDQSQLLRSLKCIRNINYLKLLQKLREKNCIKSDTVEQIMLQVERCDFTTNPYEDRAQQIGFNTTISAPHMHALTLEMLKDHAQESMKCLDIGIGSGWMTTALAKLMKNENAICYGLDHLQGVLNISKKNILKNHRELLESGRIVLVQGDGREGLEDYAPFDIIHLGAAATLKAVNKFIHQLAPNGILCGPIIKDSFSQEFMIIKKNAEGQISKETVLHVTYGSLVAVEDQYQEKDEEEYYENADDQITFQQQVIHVEKQPDQELDDEEENLSDRIHGSDDEEEDDNRNFRPTAFFRSLLNSGRNSTDNILNRLANYQDALRHLFNNPSNLLTGREREQQQQQQQQDQQVEQLHLQQQQQPSSQSNQENNEANRNEQQEIEESDQDDNEDIENGIFDQQQSSSEINQEEQQQDDSNEEIREEDSNEQSESQQEQIQIEVNKQADESNSNEGNNA